MKFPMTLSHYDRLKRENENAKKDRFDKNLKVKYNYLLDTVKTKAELQQAHREIRKKIQIDKTLQRINIGSNDMLQSFEENKKCHERTRSGLSK